MEYLRMDETRIPQVAHLETVCFNDPWSMNSLCAELKNPLSLWLIAVEGEDLAGYVGSQSVLGWADMMNLAVAPKYRRRGIGEKLIAELIRQLKENQVTCLTLEVRVSNEPAIALYQKMGFKEVGRRPGYYRNPKEDALILRKEWDV